MKVFKSIIFVFGIMCLFRSSFLIAKADSDEVPEASYGQVELLREESFIDLKFSLEQVRGAKDIFDATAKSIAHDVQRIRQIKSKYGNDWTVLGIDIKSAEALDVMLEDGFVLNILKTISVMDLSNDQMPKHGGIIKHIEDLEEEIMRALRENNEVATFNVASFEWIMNAINEPNLSEDYLGAGPVLCDFEQKYYKKFYEAINKKYKTLFNRIVYSLQRRYLVPGNSRVLIFDQLLPSLNSIEQIHETSTNEVSGIWTETKNFINDDTNPQNHEAFTQLYMTAVHFKDIAKAYSSLLTFVTMLEEQYVQATTGCRNILLESK